LGVASPGSCRLVVWMGASVKCEGDVLGECPSELREANDALPRGRPSKCYAEWACYSNLRQGRKEPPASHRPSGCLPAPLGQSWHLQDSIKVHKRCRACPRCTSPILFGHIDTLVSICHIRSRTIGLQLQAINTQVYESISPMQRTQSTHVPNSSAPRQSPHGDRGCLVPNCRKKTCFAGFGNTKIYSKYCFKRTFP
jgi:hypothetical protein